MYRNDGVTAVATLPELPTDSIGTPGFFTGGNPGASPPLPATKVRFWWLNLVQESLMALLSATGLAPNKNDSMLVLQAVGIIGRRGATFYTPAVTTWVAPAGVYRVKYRIWGGGGAGGAGTVTGAGGSGGGPGGYTEGFATVTPGTTYSITVGAGGAAVANSNGASGGTSSFGTFASATGGSGGSYSSGGAQTSSVGNAGAGSGGIFTPSLPSGGQAIAINGSYCFGGASGGSFGTQGNSSSGGLGGSGAVPGAGGGGGANGAAGGANGGSGGNGYIVLEY